MKRFPLVGLLLAGGIFAACGTAVTPPSPPDGGTDVTPPDDNVSVPDTGLGSDAGPPPDGGPARDAATDGSAQGDGGANTCASQAIIDLNMAGTVTGGVLHYMGDNTAAWTAQTMGHPHGTSPIRAPSGSAATCVTMSGQIVMKYTPTHDALLRISTTNPGTPRTFDTVLWVTAAHCSATLTSAVCNDDDPEFAASADRRVSSLVTPGSVFLGGPTHPVYILLGGFYPPANNGDTIDHGAFELTIAELTPVAAGGACDVAGISAHCAPNLSCVPSPVTALMGTCQADGTAAGTSCRAASPECDVGPTPATPALTCDSTTRLCQAPVATAGGACDAFHACATGLACLFNTRGNPVGSCVAVGTRVGAPCRPAGASSQCDTVAGVALGCDTTLATPVCEAPGTLGMRCVTGETLCPTGSSCVTPNGSSTVGTCVANSTTAGSRCETTMMCTGGLTCTPVLGATAGEMHCATLAAAGGAWNPTTDCPTGSTPFISDFSDRERGTCGPDGGSGGACRTSGTACDAMLTCSATVPVAGATGLCQTLATDGMPCDDIATGCGMGLSCVHDAVPATTRHCHMNGTVAGALCRGGDTPCNTGLTCAGTVLSAGSCQSAATMGGACDPLNGTTHCPTGTVCMPTSYNAGTCLGGVVPETEPNSTPASVMAAAVTAPTAVRVTMSQHLAGGVGGMSAAIVGDVNCVAVTVAAHGNLLAQVSDGNGRCPDPFTSTANRGIELDMYATNGTTLLGISRFSGPGNCATIDGARMVGGAALYPYAHNLDAGTYFVCARLGTDVRGTASNVILAVAPLAGP